MARVCNARPDTTAPSDRVPGKHSAKLAAGSSAKWQATHCARRVRCTATRSIKPVASLREPTDATQPTGLTEPSPTAAILGGMNVGHRLYRLIQGTRSRKRSASGPRRSSTPEFTLGRTGRVHRRGPNPVARRPWIAPIPGSIAIGDAGLVCAASLGPGSWHAPAGRGQSRRVDLIAERQEPTGRDDLAVGSDRDDPGWLPGGRQH